MPKKYTKRGRLRIYNEGHTPWTTDKNGRFKQSEEFKKYMSKRMSGKNNPMYGMTKEKCPNWKGKINYCIDCGKKITYDAKKCSHCAKIGLLIKEKNGKWQGGKSFELYSSLFNQQLKDRIRVRDNFICQLCGVPELECKRRLGIHHIDYDKTNCNERNLTSLCNKCNAKVNQDRNKWKEYFLKKMENNICPLMV